MRVLGLGVLGMRILGLDVLGLGVLSPSPMLVVIPALACGRRCCSTARAGPQRSARGAPGAGDAGRMRGGCGVWPEGAKGTRCSALKGTLGVAEVSPRRACGAASAAVCVFPSKAVQQAAALIFKPLRRDFASGRAQAEPGRRRGDSQQQGRACGGC